MATVRYFVNDVEKSLQFYTALLGFTVKQDFGGNMAILERDGLTLWLAGPNASATRPMPDGRMPQPGGWNRFVLTFSDLDAAVSALRSSGAAFRNNVISGPGGRQTLIEDPDGNPIELFEPR